MKSTIPSVINYQVKILQFGEGNFLRCFVDWMVDIMNKKGLFQGSVVIVQPIKEGKVDLLNRQNGKYNVFLRGIKNNKLSSERYLIESVTEGINPYDDYERLLKVVENPDIRFIISNTTEAGIVFNPEDSFDLQPPLSFPGKLTAVLYHRFKYFNESNDKGFILFPCELIDFNGQKLKEIVLKLSEIWKLGDEFKNWVNQANYFCNTLVDRIVPGFPVKRAEDITKEIGYEDKLIVDGEPFHLWVIEAPNWIESEFPAKKAGLNVLFVDNLVPFRDRKVRILNGSHTIMTPVSYLLGIETVKEAVEHPLTGNFIRETIYEEIIPNIDLSREELVEFAENTLQRFKNPFIEHYFLKISVNSISKFTTRVLPTLIKLYDRTQKLPERIVFSFACLILFYRAQCNGQSFELKDDENVISFFKVNWERVDNGIISLNELIKLTLENTGFWQQDLTRIHGLESKISEYILKVKKYGIAQTLENLSHL